MSEEKKDVTPMDDEELEKVTGGGGTKKKAKAAFFKCPQCNMIFNSQAKVDKHVKKLHS